MKNGTLNETQNAAQDIVGDLRRIDNIQGTNLEEEYIQERIKIEETFNCALIDLIQELQDSDDRKTRTLGILIEEGFKANLDKHSLDSMIFEYTQNLDDNLEKTNSLEDIESIVFSIMKSKETLLSELDFEYQERIKYCYQEIEEQEADKFEESCEPELEDDCEDSEDYEDEIEKIIEDIITGRVDISKDSVKDFILDLIKVAGNV